MTLREAIRDLASFDKEDAIFAVFPFTEESESYVLPEPESGLAKDIEKPGFKYFMTVFVASDFLEDWAASLSVEPTLEEKCQRLIRYATTDA